MGTVLEFRNAREPRTCSLDQTATNDLQPCEIVIFPGVRIERNADRKPHIMRDILIVDSAPKGWAKDQV